MRLSEYSLGALPSFDRKCNKHSSSTQLSEKTAKSILFTSPFRNYWHCMSHWKLSRFRPFTGIQFLQFLLLYETFRIQTVYMNKRILFNIIFSFGVIFWFIIKVKFHWHHYDISDSFWFVQNTVHKKYVILHFSLRIIL